MSLFDGKPIKRVDFSPKYDVQSVPHDFYAGMGRCTACTATHEEVAANLAPRSCPGTPPRPASECVRTWQAVVASAEASNVSTPSELRSAGRGEGLDAACGAPGLAAEACEGAVDDTDCKECE